jgi:dimethylhistidine N-methyltransferase
MNTARALPLSAEEAGASAQPTLQLVPAAPSPLALEVERGLTSSPKTLTPWLFYDAAGSAMFETITQLPEYYLTRAERSIFAAHADEIVELARKHSQLPLHILELGAGSASKTGLVLAAAVRAQGRVLYQPIDVSASALAHAETHLEEAVPGVEVEPHVADYTRGYGQLQRPQGPRLALYIGSSIGNFEPEDALEVLRELRQQLLPGDCLLLGADLRKDPSLLLPAYNDAQGVTAAFNKNVLVRINRDLGGSFDVTSFDHVARWNARRSRIEMHLVSRIAQTARIEALDLTVRFKAGESIHTENSYKYTKPRLARMLAQAGFASIRQWKDDAGLFLVTLAGVCAD